ncbi:MAG: hypothetical protein EBV06_00155 [Planctomycetia bacterium]|nr:hypothetical protein [Planctomycetia bacterium]
MRQEDLPESQTMSRLIPLFFLASLLAWLLPPSPRPVWVRGHAPPGATVRVKNTHHVSIADAHGRFTLPQGERFTASLAGHFITGASGHASIRLTLKALPKHDDADYQWAAPAECASCHQTIYNEWSGGAHSGSATSAGFRRYYRRVIDEKPDGAGVCTSCHAPGLRDDDLAFFDLRRAEGPLSGVHCDYCHKVHDLNAGDIGLTHGRFLLKLLRPSKGQLFFGPRDDADRGDDAYSPLHRDSRYCAACHEGNVFGIPVYTTYSEWLDSPAGRAGMGCQECHNKAGHTFSTGTPGLELEVGFTHTTSGTFAEVRLTPSKVGHRLPTGFVERRLVMTLEAGDYREETTFARRVTQPFWHGEAGADTRLRPGEPFVKRVRLPSGVPSLRVLITRYRYQTQPDDGQVILDRKWSR